MESQLNIPKMRVNETNQYAMLVLAPEEAATIMLLASKIAGKQSAEHENQREKQRDDDKLVSLAYGIYQSRRCRDYFFESGLFSEPAWDLLLAAYCLNTPEKILTVSGLCHSAGCPFTTALRWIERLEGLGLMERRKCDRDGRMIYVYLTEEGRSKIESYLRRVFCNEMVPISVAKLRYGD
jgi:DNA-binding MarR family transcriptional regulator